MESTTCKLKVLTKDVFFQVVPKNEPQTKKTRERAVVFVHGFTGDAAGTWKRKEEGESFASLLATDSDLADHDFYVFQYVTNTFSAPAIENIVGQLKSVLGRHLDGSRIFFLAHSMGGLVSMRYLLRLLEEGQPHNVGGLLLYGCPMTGVEWVKYARAMGWIAGVKNPLIRMFSKMLMSSKQLDEVTTGSEFLERVSNDWAMRVVNGGHYEVPPNLRAWVPVRIVSGNDDWVVKEHSARAFYSKVDWRNVASDHRSLVKPADRSEETYQIARDFFKECRNSMKPTSMVKLRGIADEISGLHRGLHVSDFNLHLIFDEKEFPSNHSDDFGLPGYRAFELHCSYRRLITSDFLRLGFAMGPIAFKSLWNDDFAFLHSLSLTSVSDEDSEKIKQQLRPVMGSGERGWASLFHQPSLRISPKGNNWYELRAHQIETGNDGLTRKYYVPEQARSLVGREVMIETRFRGLVNSQIKGYTVTFPWLTEGFDVTVTLKGKATYFISSHALNGAHIEKAEEPSKIAYSSSDLVLPKSSIRFDWQHG